MTIVATAAFAGSYDVALNTRSILDVAEQAAAAGAQLVVFPEACLQGYPPDFARIYPERVRAAMDSAEPVPSGPHVTEIAQRAKELGIHIVYGLHEEGGSAGVIYNTAVLTGPEGFIGKYRKVHVGITEQLTWRTGNDWPVFQTAIGRIGMLICYDKMWPESTRELTLRGAEILVMPSAWPTMFGADDEDPEDNYLLQKYLVYDRARAVENARWFISSNYAGELGGSRYFGLSQIVDPFGRVLESTGMNKPGLAIADIDIRGGITKAHTTHGAFLLRDRRLDTYLAASGQIPLGIEG